MSESIWRHHERWNEAIAEVVCSREVGGEAVYLDLGDGVFYQIAVPADPAPTDLVRGLVSAVNPVPGIVWRPAEVFRPHLARVKTWRPSESIDPPRTLGLPAPLTLAAENMHEGNGRAASNNCGRLASRLDLTHEQTDRCTCANRGSTKQTPTRCAIVAASDATHGACRPTDGAAWRFLRRLRNAVEKGFAGLRARGFAPLGAE